MKAARNLKTGMLIWGLAAPVLLLAVLLLAAGRLSYWQGWVYGGSSLLLLAVNYLLLRGRPDLIQERLSPGQGTKRWDKAYFALSTPLFFVAILLAALDAGRYRWGPRVPWWAYLLAGLVYSAGQALHLWAKATNRWFATVVRIQNDRGQEVYTSGPYRFVRHPGYLGGVLFMLATPLLLGSWLALIPQAVAAGLIVLRTYLEDRTLQAELPGYAEYARKVRHRLGPLW
jgi:protein-S-isoprenylcysteine O-methyltransferase Ste14